MRGARGREEAAQRGLFTGNGPNAGISNGEKKVTLWGLPGKIEGEGVQNLAKGFKIVGAEAGKPEIVKIALYVCFHTREVPYVDFYYQGPKENSLWCLGSSSHCPRRQKPTVS